MFKNPRNVFLLLIALTVVLIFIDLPQNYHLKYQWGFFKIDQIINPPVLSIRTPWFRWQKELKTQLGLDLSGGTHLVLEADMKGIVPNDRQSAIDSAKNVIERRVNFFGVSEPIVQSAKSADSYRIIVEMPGITDVEEAVKTIGQTAKLEFREFTDERAATSGGLYIPTLSNTTAVGIDGKDLRNAGLSFSTQSGEPEVALEFTPEGSKKFAEVTKRLVNKQLAIFLDELPLTWPRVNTPITDGKAVITGSFSSESAKGLALQINAGALPVPVSVVEKRVIGATLGADSVAKSIRAGLIGLIIVGIFMIAQYGRLGLIADCALVLYGLLTFALFRWIPVTLTLPGVAGFILSIGMAVDSNILIFERYKEELHSGKPMHLAMELGFGRAWESIRDANFTTILTALILFNPGNWQVLPSSGLVRGFAATLLIGVLVSLFTGVVVSRTFIRVLYLRKNSKK